MTITLQTAHVTVPNGDVQMPAYIATPDAPGSYPGVVVIQEIFGVNAHIRDVTERIARSGYVAIAPAIFHRVAPADFEIGYSAEDIALGRRYKQQTSAAELISDIQATIDYLKHQPQVYQRFGCIGFCFGGHVAYLAATLDDLTATASFYGAGITSQTPGGGSPTITRTAQISGTIYTFFGMQDASIPAAEVAQIEAALEKHQISHQVFRYEHAEHGFFCDRRASYNLKAAVDAWQHVMQLFEHHLNPS